MRCTPPGPRKFWHFELPKRPVYLKFCARFGACVDIMPLYNHPISAGKKRTQDHARPSQGGSRASQWPTTQAVRSWSGPSGMASGGEATWRGSALVSRVLAPGRRLRTWASGGSGSCSSGEGDGEGGGGEGNGEGGEGGEGVGGDEGGEGKGGRRQGQRRGRRQRRRRRQWRGWRQRVRWRRGRR